MDTVTIAERSAFGAAKKGKHMGLVEELDALEAHAKELIASATDSEKLEAARVALLGKKGEITQVMHMMGKVAPEERPVLGKRANELRRMAEGETLWDIARQYRTDEEAIRAANELTEDRPEGMLLIPRVR